MKMSRLIILAVIIILGLTLRLYHLDSRPVGFTWDEAALGYNAYSLLKTGKDEYGKVLPVVFKSFGDYKPGLYIYLTVPMVKIFSLNEFATRLPSAIFGTLLILVIYLLTKNLYAPFLLAINPWAIHFSRGAWEANVALFLTTLAVLLFLKKRYLYSSLFFSLTLWTYQGAKMFTPLLLIALFIIYRPNIKKLILPVIFGIVMLIPLILNFGAQSGRLKVFSVFSYSGDLVRGITQRYLNHLSPKYLFISGDWSNIRHSIPYYGYFHLPEIITILIGIYVLVKLNNQTSKLLFSWLFLAILPSALSRDIVSGVRSLPMLIPLVIMSGIGLSKFYSLALPAMLRIAMQAGLLLSLILFIDLYFVHSPFFTARDMLYPYKEALQIIEPYLKDYNRVIFTDKLGQPYIYTLFYYKINPALYQSQNKFVDNANGDVGYVPSFEKFVFQKVDWRTQRGDSSTIFVGDNFELPEQDMNPINLVRLGEVYYPNGKHALHIVALK
jgi:4-amino-4-deoxy-L-arabinose transferase-like glycosyltransferase